MATTIIDKTYLAREPLYVPDGTTLNVAADGDPVDNQVDVVHFIEMYERELMVSAIGRTLYDEIIAIIEADTLDDGGNEKYKALVDGLTYTRNGKDYVFEGLRGYEKNSLIAYYVYAQYLRAMEDRLTTLGTAKPLAKNSEATTPTKKFVRAWQTFLTMYQTTDVTVPVVSVNAFGTQGIDYRARTNQQRSLYQFLDDMTEVNAAWFPDVVFGIIPLEDSYNSFGI